MNASDAVFSQVARQILARAGSISFIYITIPVQHDMSSHDIPRSREGEDVYPNHAGYTKITQPKSCHSTLKSDSCKSISFHKVRVRNGDVDGKLLTVPMSKRALPLGEELG